MIKKLFYSFLSVAFIWSQGICAADLVDVYCEAVKCDPTFNSALANLMANRQDVPINQATLLPRLDIHADVERQRIELEGISFASFQSSGVFVPVASTKTFYNNSVHYYLRLSQPIFNFKSWSKLEQAKASVKQAEASFCASAQDLMARVVRTYFDVLIADATLFYTRENKRAVAEQLRQTKEQFKVGTLPITGVYEAQASYNLIVAQEITDRYELARRIEALRSITSKLYCNLHGLSGFLPLIKPQPADIKAWVCTAEKQNYELQAARFASLAAQQNVKLQAADKLPVINSFSQFQYDLDSNFQASGVLNRQKTVEAGLQLDWAPLQGGGITAKTIQARYLVQKACSDQEFIHRKVISEARNAYLGVFSGIAQIRADHASIYSSQQSLQATVESYKAGLRTMLDVLNQQTQLYDAQKNYARDRYEYIYQTVLLKQAAGTLSVCDLQQINVWLYSRIDISKIDALLEGCVTPTTH